MVLFFFNIIHPNLKIFKNVNSIGWTFFRMKLCCKNIFRSYMIQNFLTLQLNLNYFQSYIHRSVQNKNQPMFLLYPTSNVLLLPVNLSILQLEFFWVLSIILETLPLIKPNPVLLPSSSPSQIKVAYPNKYPKEVCFFPHV